MDFIVTFVKKNWLDLQTNKTKQSDNEKVTEKNNEFLNFIPEVMKVNSDKTRQQNDFISKLRNKT